MSDVFGSRGGKRGGANTPEAPAGPSRTKPTAQGQNCYIEYDNETGEMKLTLPTHLAQYKNELARDLYEEYFLANPDESIFMVRPDRRKLLPFSYDAPLSSEWWDDDGSKNYREMFERITKQGVVLVKPGAKD